MECADLSALSKAAIPTSPEELTRASIELHYLERLSV